jgi:ALG3 protein
MRRLPLYLLIAWFGLEAIYAEYNIRQGETCTFDWDAYMEQCSKLDRSKAITTVDHAAVAPRFNFNYTELRGDTGPLVYPALHTWIHLILLKAFSWDAAHWTTESTPKDIPGYEERTFRPNDVIERIQRLYLVLHLATVAIAAAILIKTGLLNTELDLCDREKDDKGKRRTTSFPGLLRYEVLSQLLPTVIACILFSLSSRVRNVSTTGLFNDSWSMLLAHLSVLLFVHRRWNWGCLVYSASVAIKMNTLLMAPGLLFLLLAEGGIRFAIPRLAICGFFQLFVALPFLLTDAAAYLKRAFDLGRAFEQKWSVNWSFLPEAIFSSKLFALGLLSLQSILLVLFVRWVWRPEQHRPSGASVHKGDATTVDEEAVRTLLLLVA